MNFNLFGPSCLWYSHRLSRRTDSTHRAPRQSVWNLKDLYGNITSFVFKAKYRGDVDIFLQNKHKLTSIVVICRPCSRKWWILANIGDFEGLTFGVYLSVIRERQGRRSSQNRSSAKPKFKRSHRLLHSDWMRLISDMSNNEETAWPFEVGTRKFATDHLSHMCFIRWLALGNLSDFQTNGTSRILDISALLGAWFGSGVMRISGWILAWRWSGSEKISSLVFLLLRSGKCQTLNLQNRQYSPKFTIYGYKDDKSQQLR